MPALYIVAAQPNPPGKDATSGTTTNDQLNAEWVEFAALEDRNLVGDVLSQLTFNRLCQRTGTEELVRFSAGYLKRGQHMRVHTGRGTGYWDGNTFHFYLGRAWFVWNNGCGDRATLTYDNREIDFAFYRPNPPEGVLVRVEGTNEMVPAGQLSYRR